VELDDDPAVETPPSSGNAGSATLEAAVLTTDWSILGGSARGYQSYLGDVGARQGRGRLPM
jgi:hypothetical protein